MNDIDILKQAIAKKHPCDDSHAALKRIEAAIRFYADPRKYEGANQTSDADEECVAGVYRLDVTRDCGNKAQAILANTKLSGDGA